MPPKLKPVSAEVAIKVLTRLGFVQIRQSGSHVILKKEMHGIEVGCVVPLHRRDLATGTLRSILRQAHITSEEFMDNL